MKTIAYCQSFILLFPSLYSCTKENNLPSIEKTAQLDIKYFTQETIKKTILFEEILNSSRNPLPLNLTQELVDDYLVALGYQAGEITVLQVQELIDKLGIATVEGIQNLLEQYNLDEFTVNSINAIANGNPITDLNSIPDYLLLNQNQRELIQLANSITIAEIQDGRSCAGWGGLGAVLGVLIGGVVCGPCIIVGGILGGSIGCQAGGGKGGGNPDPHNQ